MDDVLHQGDEPLALPVDVTGKAVDILGLDDTVFDDLRHAGDGGERGFQFVGDIGGKLPPQPLPLLLGGDVHQHQHCALHLGLVEHRVGQQLDTPLSPLQPALGPLTGQGPLHHRAEGIAAVQGEDAGLLGGADRPQQAQGPGVIGQDAPLGVQQHHPLGHVLRQGGKLPLLLAHGIHLTADGVVLAADLGDEGGQLVITPALLRLLQVQVQNGADDALGQPGGQHRRQNHGQHQNNEQRLDHRGQQYHHRRLSAGQADHRAVAQPAGGIVGPAGQGGRLPLGRALAGQHGLADLRPVGVVLHLGGVCPVVIQHGAVLVHPGHPAGYIQRV